MFKQLGKIAFASVIAFTGIQATANAAIIGSANYVGTAGDNFDPGAPSGQPLSLRLDGSTIHTVANPVAAIGTPISLATTNVVAFNALVRIPSRLKKPYQTSTIATRSGLMT